MTLSRARLRRLLGAHGRHQARILADLPPYLRRDVGLPGTAAVAKSVSCRLRRPMPW